MGDISQFERIFNFNYNLVYYISSLFVLLLVLEFRLKNKNTQKIQEILLLILLVVIIYTFGFRTEYVGKDTPNNIKYFIRSTQVQSLTDVKDLGLYVVSIVSALFTKSIDVFLTILAMFYVAPIYLGIKNLKIKNSLIFFFFLFSFFFFRSMGINTQRQGLSFAVFFLALTYFIKNKNTIAYFLFLIAFFFHASIILPITVLLASKFIKNDKVPFIIYGVSTVLSIVNFKVYDILSQIPIVNILVEDRLQTYTNLEVDNYRVGFRPDFWLFNTIFLFIGYYTYKHIEKLNFEEKFYRKILVCYILLSSFFFLMFSARFSDRFGFMAWMFIPFILLPYADSRKSIGVFNTLSIFFICVFIATIFKFI